MPNINISARFSLAPLYVALLIMFGGPVSAAPQSALQDTDNEQAIDEMGSGVERG